MIDLPHHYLVRAGALAPVYRFRAADGRRYRRRERVICQTELGLQVGDVLSEIAADEPAHGQIIRPMTVEDQLLQDRLQRFRVEAVESCRRELATAGHSATLLDVDQLFDGRTLIFHFLGPVGEEVQALTQRLAEQYERKVRTRHFTKLLAEGCGPGCGTSDAEGGCGGGCATCVVATACATRTLPADPDA